MNSTERVKTAYNTFYRGLTDIGDIPSWDDAPTWVRDVVIVAYLQGTLDAPREPKRKASR